MLFRNVSPKLFALPFLVFLIISFSFGEFIPSIWPDEVLFYSPAFELSKHGIFRTEVLRGLIPGMETHTLWMPPVYMLSLSGVFSVFGDSLNIARNFSSFLSLISLFIVYLLLSRFKAEKSVKLIALSFLATDFLFLKFSHTARMESACLLFALISFYILFRTYDTDKPLTNTEVFSSGIFLSLSFLSHPFGIVHSLPVLFALYLRERFNPKTILLYAFAGFLPIALWGLYVIPNLDLFFIQFGAQLKRKNDLLGKFSIIDKVKIIFSVYKFPLIKLLLFSAVVGFVGFSFRKTFDRIALFLLFWLFSILLFLFLSSESWYSFYMTVPLCVLLGVAAGKNRILSFFVSISFLYNVIVLVFVLVNHFYVYKSPLVQDKFFTNLENEIASAKKVYLQVIPDPYFYLKERHPDKVFLEFIPGELAIPPEYFQKTIQDIDVFIFYNESHVNEHIASYLIENATKFTRSTVKIQTGKFADFNFDAYIYKRK